MPVQEAIASALDLVSDGLLPREAKPLKGFTEGVFEIVAAYRSDTWRAVYAIKIGEDIWVLHSFQKKSNKGIATPKHEIDLISQRLKRLKEHLK